MWAIIVEKGAEFPLRKRPMVKSGGYIGAKSCLILGAAMVAGACLASVAGASSLVMKDGRIIEGKLGIVHSYGQSYRVRR
jgi:hypothetical protein